MSYDRWSSYTLGIAVGTYLNYRHPDLFWFSVIGGVLLSLIMMVIGAIKEVNEESA